MVPSEVKRPRLGLVAYEYPPKIGGIQTYAAALARHMTTRGYDVHVFASQTGEPVASETLHPILTSDLATDLPRLARFDMDLWHAVSFGYAPLACMKRPFVMTIHGSDFLTPWVGFKMQRVPAVWRVPAWLNRQSGSVRRRVLQWLRRAGCRLALRHVDHVFACSRFTAGLFHERFPFAPNVQVVPNGVDQHLIDDMRARPRTTDRHPRRILTVATLYEVNSRKNVDGLIRAMGMVGQQLDLEYWVVGDGDLRPALERLAASIGVTDRVRFLGRVDEETLCNAYASSSLFALVPKPRPGDVEGFGIVYLEAAAAGTPSLAGRYGGTTEAVADGRSGFFVDDPSPHAIAHALTRFFTGQVRFDESAVRAHAAEHTWSAVLENVHRAYQRLLHRRPQTAALAPGRHPRPALPKP